MAALSGGVLVIVQALGNVTMISLHVGGHHFDPFQLNGISAKVGCHKKILPINYISKVKIFTAIQIFGLEVINCPRLEIIPKVVSNCSGVAASILATKL